MTSTGYYMARLAQAFGVFRRAQRMSDAAGEMHLLREAEAVLGSMVWENVQDIEAVAVEYWNLRKLVRERDAVRQRIADCEERLAHAHEERTKLLGVVPEENQQLIDRRAVLLEELEELSLRRDHVVAEAREVRRAFEGMKMKLEFVSNEPGDPAEKAAGIEAVTARLAELKTRFEELKQERAQLARDIEQGDARIDEVDDQLAQLRQNRREEASASFAAIGEGNKEISTLRVECSLLDTQMRQLYAEIGRYVSRHHSRSSACQSAAEPCRGLVEVMRALRRSIAYNHRLAGT